MVAFVSVQPRLRKNKASASVQLAWATIALVVGDCKGHCRVDMEKDLFRACRGRLVIPARILLADSVVLETTRRARRACREKNADLTLRRPALS